MIEDLKAKLQEVLQDCGEYSNQCTPSFTYHTESVTATLDKPAACLVTTGHIHELSTSTCNEVYFKCMFLNCFSSNCYTIYNEKYFSDDHLSYNI